MSHLPSFSATAFLIADPTRSVMLTALLDGRALPAGELAYAAGITAQTASSHLAKLLAGGLVAVEIEGRHRYYRLAGCHVAEALETLATIRPDQLVKHKVLSQKGRELQFCRCCYDHLAGQVGVAITRGLQERGYIVATPGKQFEVTLAGIEWFGKIGLEVSALKPTRQGVARQCLDWTERTYHLAGPLGTQFMRALCALEWLHRVQGSRAVLVTPKGWLALQLHLAVNKKAFRTA